MNSSFMDRAIYLAKQSASEGEVPVGAVVVRDGKIIGEGRNRREQKKSALSHAEIEAIAAANKTLDDWRLEGCTIYVTLEPCPMCTGAIINARISEVVFGAYDSTMGCIDSVVNLCDYPLGCQPQIYGGIREDECRALLSEFFEKIRKNNG